MADKCVKNSFPCSFFSTAKWWDIFNIKNIHLIHAKLVSPEYNILSINVLNQEAYSSCGGAQQEYNNSSHMAVYFQIKSSMRFVLNYPIYANRKKWTLFWIWLPAMQSLRFHMIHPFELISLTLSVFKSEKKKKSLNSS